MAEQASASQEQEFNQFELIPFLFIVLKKWYLLIFCIIIGYLCAFTYLRYATPKFEASAKLELNKLSEEDPLDGILGKRSIGFRQAKDIENDLTKLKSIEVTAAAMKKMKVTISYFLVGRIRGLTQVYHGASPAQFKKYKCQRLLLDRYLKLSENGGSYSLEILNDDLEISNTTNSDLESAFGVKADDGIFLLEKKGTHLLLGDSLLDLEIVESGELSELYIRINSPEKIQKTYLNGLTVKKEGEQMSTIVKLTSVSNIPQYSIQYVKALAESYVDLDLETRIETLNKANKFVGEKINHLWDSLLVLDDSINFIRRSNNVPNISSQTQDLFKDYKELFRLGEDLNQKINYIESVKRYVVDIDEFENFTPPIIVGVEDDAFNSQIRTLLDDYNGMVNKMLGIKKTNPYYQMSKSSIQQSIGVLKETLYRIKQQMEFELSGVNQRLAIVNNKLAKYPELETLILNLKRNYQINEALYKELLSKRVELGIELASAVSNHQFLTASSSATKIFPQGGRIQFFGLLGGIGVPVLLMFLFYYFDRRIKSIGHITAFTNVPFVGALPKVDEFGPAFIFNYPKSMLAESLRAVKNNIGYLINSKEVPVLVVTSSQSGDGKTFTAENLGAIYAYAGKKTIILGGDLRRPKLFAEFNIKRQAGLSEYLSNQIDEQGVITETGFKNLYVIGAGANPPNPAELLERDGFKVLLNFLKKQFDLIIIDTPPYQVVTDTGILASHADAMIYVTRHNSTRRDVIERVNQFDKENLPIIGIVLNAFDEKTAYGYRYTSYTRNTNYNYSGYYGRVQGDGYYVDSGSGSKRKWWNIW